MGSETRQIDEGRAYIEDRYEQTQGSIPEDPHGMVEVFARQLEHNLAIMGPRVATEQALLAVKQHLDASDFIDLSSKTSGRQYVRRDKSPHKGGGGM